MSRLFSAFCPLAWRPRSQFAHSLVSVPLFTCGYPSCNVVLRSIIWTILAIIVIINTTLLKRDTFFFFSTILKTFEREKQLLGSLVLISICKVNQERGFLCNVFPGCSVPFNLKNGPILPFVRGSICPFSWKAGQCSLCVLGAFKRGRHTLVAV